MTPRERAIDCRTDTELDGLGFTSDSQRMLFENAVEAAIIADRQSLQSELIKRLQVEKTDASPASWLALNGAIGIVQAVFASPYENLPSEEKPEDAIVKFMIPGIEVKPERGAGVDYVDMKGSFCGRMITEAESDRRVLAEREACAAWAQREKEDAKKKLESGQSFSEYYKAQLEMAAYIEDRIRSRSNPQPKEAETKQCKKLVYDVHDKYPCALNAGHEGRCKYKGQIWAEGQAKLREEAAKKKEPCNWHHACEQCQLEDGHSGNHVFPSMPFPVANPQPEVSKPLQDHAFVPYAESQCWLCSGNPARHPEAIDAPDRIALLTKIIGEQQIKIAELEKERKRYAQEILQSHQAIAEEFRPESVKHKPCNCDICEYWRSPSPNNRKA